MADYRNIGGFTFRIREAQYARPNERGMWTRAACTNCGGTIDVRQDESAVDFLHRLDDDHAFCSPPRRRPSRPDAS